MKNCYLLIDGEKSDLHEYWLLKDSQKSTEIYSSIS